MMGCTFSAVLISVLVQMSHPSCPLGCLCASDVVSCASQGHERLPVPLPPATWTLDLSHNRIAWLAAGSFHGLPRMEALRLSHNAIAQLGAGAFHNASRLRRLDLSFNRLQVVARHHLQELPALEELLLFNNRIAQVESNALIGLSRLRKVYLSHNQITDFPFFSIWRHTHPALATLDLSSNRMLRLPVGDIAMWPAVHQRALYLHNNTLVCDCSVYAMFWQWEQRGYDAVTDFKEEYKCLLRGEPRAAVHFLRRSRLFENCTAPKAVSLLSPRASVLVHEGELVRLDCATSQAEQNPSFSWTSPHQENITQLLHNGTLRLNPDGSLEIPSAQPEDSGTYRCAFFDSLLMLNETREINLTVVPPRPPDEPFNTGYTTLLGCAITLALILVYLYMTPCRCSCCRPPRSDPTTPGLAEDPSALPSIFSVPSSSPTERHARKANADRRVVFLEPLCEEQNGHAQAEFSKENLVQFQPQNLAHVRIPDYEPGFCNAT
ncbi:amphoterin-induced protein 3-like [Denticeps clupeoides]|uniref:Ig-like domain-containing protein n=1 Tax=Denticeps clupeoides TaxID=299321 RepID=A0AAY4EEI5_9TELE|nr:amphoterin-induced protein 3-like [Denticeps clupeoides]XP_028848336.1 amphoterin-induced protein 3-like [Denticeps clupeoides]